MADLGTLRPGAADTTGLPTTGSVIASPGGATALSDDSDSTFDGQSTNATGTYQHGRDLADTPSDFGTMDAVSVRLRYGWQSAPSLSTWDDLAARIVASDGTTILAAADSGGAFQSLVTPTDDATIREVGPTGFTYVNTAAGKAAWDGAILQVQWERTRNKGGDALGCRVYEGWVTGTYTESAGDPLDPGSIAATAGVEKVTITRPTGPSGGTESYTERLYHSTDGTRGTLLETDPTYPYDHEPLTPEEEQFYTLEVDDGDAQEDTAQVSATPTASGGGGTGEVTLHSASDLAVTASAGADLIIDAPATTPTPSEDVVLLVVFVDHNANPSTPTGFEALLVTTVSSGVSCAVFGKVAGSSEPSTYTIASNGQMAGFAAIVSDAQVSSFPTNVLTDSNAEVGNSVTAVLPGINGADGGLLLAVLASRSTQLYASDDGMTPLEVSLFGSNNRQGGAWAEGLVADEATGDRSFTRGGGGTFWSGGMLAFAPGEAGPAGPSAALTGTLADGATEAEIQAGGETLIITLSEDTWVASGGTFDAVRQDIIDGLTSAGAEVAGWNAEVRDALAVTAVVRTSDIVVTITLPAFASYEITESETVTVTVPASALVTSTDPVVATPTFEVTPAAEPDAAETLTDGFGAAELDAQWTAGVGFYSAGSGGVVEQAGGRLRLTVGSGDVDTIGIHSTDPYDLANSHFHVRFYPPAWDGVAMYAVFDCGSDLSTASEAQLSFTVETYPNDGPPAEISFRYRNGSTTWDETRITYDPVAHAWLRYLHDGTDVLWQTSPDGETWTTRRTVAVSTLTSLDFGAMYAAIGGGKWGIESTSYVAEFDAFNNLATTDAIPEQDDWDEVGVKVISPGEFDVDWDGFIHPPWSLVELGGTKYLYFGAALNDTNPDHRAIGVATSTDDGETWTKHASNPVLEHNPSGSSDPEEGAVSAAVLVDGSTFHVWYGANHDTGGDLIDMDVRYANSTDGIEFSNDSLVLSTSGFEYWPQAAIKIGSTYYLYLTIIDGLEGAAGGRGPLYVMSGTDPANLGNLTEVDAGPWSHARIVDLDEDRFVVDLCRNDQPFLWNWYEIQKSAPTVISGPISGKQTELTTDGHLGRVYDVDPATNHWRVYHLRWWTDEEPTWPPADDGIYRFEAFAPDGIEISAELAAAGQVAAALGVGKPLASDLTGSGTIATELQVAKPLAGTLAGATTFDAVLTVAKPVSAALSGTAAITASLLTAKQLAALLAADAQLAGELSVSKPLAASLAGSSALAADLSIDTLIELAALLTAAGHVAATLSTGKPLSASLSGAGAILGSLAIEKPLSASIAGAGSLAVDLSVDTVVELAAALAGAGSMGGTLAVAKPLGAGLSGEATMAAAILAEKPLGAVLAGSGLLSADLSVSTVVQLAAVLAGSAALDARLVTSKPLGATLSAQSALAVALLVEKPLAASLEGAGFATADLSAEQLIQLAASLVASSAIAADVTLEKRLVAVLAGSTELAAVIIARKRLAAVLRGDGDLVAALTVSRAIIQFPPHVADADVGIPMADAEVGSPMADAAIGIHVADANLRG